jgi:hypothetical protein
MHITDYDRRVFKEFVRFLCKRGIFIRYFNARMDEISNSHFEDDKKCRQWLEAHPDANKKNKLLGVLSVQGSLVGYKALIGNAFDWSDEGDAYAEENGLDGLDDEDIDIWENIDDEWTIYYEKHLEQDAPPLVRNEEEYEWI